MENPSFDAPPVPPKDTPRKRRTQFDQSSSAPNSASKRKRENHFTDTSEDELAGHTPKRHRRTPPRETEHSGFTSPRRQSTLHRKKGVNNLSSLNLRHEAEQARLQELMPRGSKFQEGSLTDKPSNKPPSAFTRIMSNEAGSLGQVDTLMSDYHDGMPTPDESTDSFHGARQPGDETVEMPDPSSAIYRFGHKLVNSFRPVALWNKIWAETKEELTLKNMEIERKRRQKIEAERQYALMQQAGQIPTKNGSFANFRSISQRDSGIEMVEENRLSAFSPYPIAPRDQAPSRTEGKLFDHEGDGERTLRGRLHFKRPSLSNLRFDLKRARSEVNLFSASHRESSPSLSPAKNEVEDAELRKSHSRADLKKQQKLSKRVSNLEMKLHVARRELDDALVEASPMPKFGSRHERFTPLSSLKKKFVPGGLPSLPSERLLDPEVMGEGQQDAVHIERKGEDEATIRASRAQAYPVRAADLFYDDTQDDCSIQHNINDSIIAMNPAKIVDAQSSPAGIKGIIITQATPESLRADAETPLSDKSKPFADQVKVKVSKKQSRAKKRKSGNLDTSYKPAADDEDDEDIRDAKNEPKKRRSSGTTQAIVQHTVESQDVTMETVANIEDQTDVFRHYADELGEDIDEQGGGSVRLSIDSTTRSLEPLYEEEEETSTIPLNHEPIEPTALATPARFGRTPRSLSPAKRSTTEAAAEELVFTRAADAVKNHPGRQAQSADAVKKHPGRQVQSAGSAKGPEYEWPEDVF